MNWLQQLSEWISRFKWWYTVRPWEQAIRVRCGKWIKAVNPGIHIRVPLIDEIFVQNTRQRVLNLPTQTVTTKAGVTITLSAIVLWRIENVQLLYEKLHTPEDWIYNCVLAAIADSVRAFDGDVSPSMASEVAEKQLAPSAEMGLQIEGISITDFAIVRTYRLISGEGNTGWTWNRVGALDAQGR